VNGDDKSGGGFVGLVGVGCGYVWDMPCRQGELLMHSHQYEHAVEVFQEILRLRSAFLPSGVLLSCL
jgi:hypothetical protein